MARRRVRWTLRIESRRAFLERGALTAAWAGLAACTAPGDDAAAPSAVAPTPVHAHGPITPNEHFYVTSCCGSPSVDIATWVLSMKSRGVELVTVDYAALRALPAREKEHTLECIDAGPGYPAISNALWTGLPLREVFAALGVVVPAGTVELKLDSADGYSTSLPVADLDKPVWLVWLMNGVELPREHGYPVRMLVPGRYGMKNPKWLTSIDFFERPYTGFWEADGWSNAATYHPNALVPDPRSEERVPAGAIVASGTAFAGSDPIASVEVAVDGGDWSPATLDYAPGADVWTLWHFEVTLAAGAHTLQARCTTASGAQSGPASEATDFLTGFDGSEAVEFTVV